MVSTLLLLLIYVAVSTAAQSYHGTRFLAGNSSDVLNALGGGVFGSPLDKLLIISATVQTVERAPIRTVEKVGVMNRGWTWPNTEGIECQRAIG